MKKIFFVIILFLLAFSEKSYSQDAQEILFTIGDTTETVNIPGNVKTGFITVCDSAVSGTDTILAVVKQGSSIPRYALLGVHDLAGTATTTNVASMIPGASATRTYSFDVNQVPGGTIVIYRTNTSTDNQYAPRTRIIVSWK